MRHICKFLEVRKRTFRANQLASSCESLSCVDCFDIFWFYKWSTTIGMILVTFSYISSKHENTTKSILLKYKQNEYSATFPII